MILRLKACDENRFFITLYQVYSSKDTFSSIAIQKELCGIQDFEKNFDKYRCKSD